MFLCKEVQGEGGGGMKTGVDEGRGFEGVCEPFPTGREVPGAFGPPSSAGELGAPGTPIYHMMIHFFQYERAARVLMHVEMVTNYTAPHDYVTMRNTFTYFYVGDVGRG